jgi:hypothetical protein
MKNMYTLYIYTCICGCAQLAIGCVVCIHANVILTCVSVHVCVPGCIKCWVHGEKKLGRMCFGGYRCFLADDDPRRQANPIDGDEEQR